MTEPIFQLVDVTVKYGSAEAIRSISFELLREQALGLIGVNGAGKTSTVRALLGMVKLEQGKVHVLGQARLGPNTFKRIGFAPEDGSPPDYLTGQEYLSFVGQLKITSRQTIISQVRELLEWFELDSNKPIKNYSKGMRRRLILAQAFIGNPELLILDEPLNGLDPLMIVKLRDKLQQYRKNGGSVLYSSHILAELENSCTHIVIMNRGTVVTKASTSELMTEFGNIENAFRAKVGKS